MLWRRSLRRPPEPLAFRDCVATLAELEVQAIMQIRPQVAKGSVTDAKYSESSAGSEPALKQVVLQCLSRPSLDSSTSSRGAGVEAVAGAYDAGLSVSFGGLFAGESRRRISPPGYPFQRRRHWIDPPMRPILSSG